MLCCHYVPEESNYCELWNKVFPIHDIEIRIKVRVRTLPTRQTTSALKWACYAGNGTYMRLDRDYFNAVDLTYIYSFRFIHVYFLSHLLLLIKSLAMLLITHYISKIHISPCCY